MLFNLAPKSSQSMENHNVRFGTSLCLFGFIHLTMLITSLSAAGAPISWSRPRVERLLAPGFVVQESVSFTTSVDLENPTIAIVPELMPHVMVTSQVPGFIAAGTVQPLTMQITASDSIPMGSRIEGTIKIKAGQKTLARPLEIAFEIQPSAFKSPDLASLVQDADGMVYPINQLILLLSENESSSIAEEIARNIEAEIVGFSFSANLYQLELNIQSLDDLNNLLVRLAGDPRLSGVSKNFAFSLQSSDLANLTSCHRDRSEAYLRVRLLDAWKIITHANAASSFVHIGIIDSGIDRTHPEFNGVSVRPENGLLSPADTNGHGTSVSGIIGAGNHLQARSCTPPSDLQMNGFMSGIVAADYYLNVVSAPLLFAVDFAALSDILAREGANIINVSIGIEVAQPPLIPVNRLFVGTLRILTRRVVRSHPDVLFVFAAGNRGIDVENSVLGSLVARFINSLTYLKPLGERLPDRAWP
jgi:hypothetical protein